MVPLIRTVGDRLRPLFSESSGDGGVAEEWSLEDWTGFEGSVEGAEVIGRSPLSYLAAAESVSEMFHKHMMNELARNGIEEPEPEEWYPLAGALAVLYELGEEYGEASLENAGRHIPQHVEFPPGLSGVEEALRSIDEAYHANHRGGEIGSYEFHSERSGKARVVCENPYPCGLDQGLIRGVANEFANSSVYVEETGDECRMEGDSHCEYVVKWAHRA